MNIKWTADRIVSRDNKFLIRVVATPSVFEIDDEGRVLNELQDMLYVKNGLNSIFGIQKELALTVRQVIHHDPATIVYWLDGTKTVVKTQDGDTYDPEKGLAMAICKKALGNKGNYNDVFKKWLPKED